MSLLHVGCYWMVVSPPLNGDVAAALNSHLGWYKRLVSEARRVYVAVIVVNEPNLNRAFYLPRLAREYYQADAVVHWTFSVSERQRGWLDELFHARFRELILHAAVREGLFCPTYCLMPDHFHLVWMGLRPDSDQLHGMAFLRTHLEPNLAPLKFQHQAHDHVLNEHERHRHAFASACRYILENPLRAELVKHPREWPFIGTVLPGYPRLHPLQDDFWETFWKIYAKAKHPDADKILRPPISQP
jgi:putative transposase